MWSGCFTQNRRSSSHVTITEKSNMFFSALPEDSQLPQQPAAKPYGRLRLGENILIEVLWYDKIDVFGFIVVFWSVWQRCGNVSLISDLRLFNMIHAVGGLVTGTACSASNTWPLATTWLQRSVDDRLEVNISRLWRVMRFCDSLFMFIEYLQVNPEYEEECLESRSSVNETHWRPLKLPNTSSISFEFLSFLSIGRHVIQSSTRRCKIQTDKYSVYQLSRTHSQDPVFWRCKFSSLVATSRWQSWTVKWFYLFRPAQTFRLLTRWR